jgi:hypothetical protein
VRALLHLRRAERGLRDGPLRVAGAAGSAVAFERGEGAAHFVVAVNPGDAATRLDIRLDGLDADGARLEPIDLAGLGGVTGGPIEDRRATLELPPMSGSILRIR